MFHPSARDQQAARRRGVSLAELLVVSTVMALIAGGLAALASAVQVSNRHHHGRSLTLQHGRVALERIQRALNEATANEQFPGFVSFPENVGGWSYPDTLVVWHPAGAAADPDGLPLISELVTFCPDPAAPSTLLEITVPGDNRTAPPLSDTAAWTAELDAIKKNLSARRTALTHLLRLAVPTDAAGFKYTARGAVRFEVTRRPSDKQWAEFQSGTRAWEDIDWAQGIFGSQSGLRQSWCRIELQLRPGEVEDHSIDAALPLFGSGAAYYQLRR